jgi:hypothetical protein
VRALLLALCGRIDEAVEAASAERLEVLGADFLFAKFFKMTAAERVDEARAAVREILTSNFRDPEGFYYLGLGMSRLGDLELAGELLARGVNGGYANPVALTSHVWLAPMRGLDVFDTLVATARANHEQAVAIYAGADGPAVLGVPAQAQSG